LFYNNKITDVLKKIV